MKKWLVYVLGVITGIVLTFAVAICIRLSNNMGIPGLELFETPGNYMPYSKFEVFQVIEADCALANSMEDFSVVVLIVPNENQHFYDNQEVILKKGQRAQRVGTYRYSNNMGFEKTVPVIRIVDK